MKNLRLALVAMVFAIFSVVGANKAQAQITTGEQVLAAAGNLVSVQVGSVNVNAVDVVDVSNVLNNNTVTVVALNDILNNLTIDNVLNNLLRDANIITDNQIVVGVVAAVLGTAGQVITPEQFLVANKKTVRSKK
jgi:hypothetical protein